MTKHSRQDEVVTLPVSELKETFFVRRELDEDRVLVLMDLYDTGANVPPIDVIRGTMEISDGRHRKAALEHLGRKETLCKLIEPMATRAEMLVRAFANNAIPGAPKPPTRADIIFVMKQLVEEGVPAKRIVEQFALFYTTSMARKALNEAQSDIADANMRKAKRAVAHDGMTAAAAAEEYGVDLDRLKADISGERKKAVTGLNSVKAGLTKQYRSNSSKTSGLLKRVKDRFEDGEVDEKYVGAVIQHIAHMQQQGEKSLKRWIRRLGVIRGTKKAKNGG